MARNTPEKREQRRQRAAEALKEQQAAERRRKMLTIGGVVAALVAVVAIVFGITQAIDTTGDTPENVPSVADDPADTESDAVPGELDGYGIVVGDPEAPHTVTIYEDLQCPACANLEAQLGDQISEAIDAGEIQVEYRLISFLDRYSTNEYSSRALNAVLVVLDKAGVEAFRAYHDDLFANQPAEGGPGFEDDELIDRAVEAGADEAEVRADIEGMVYEQWIENATDQMSKDGYNSTPTVKIDGEDSDAQGLAALLSE